MLFPRTPVRMCRTMLASRLCQELQLICKLQQGQTFEHFLDINAFALLDINELEIIDCDDKALARALSQGVFPSLDTTCAIFLSCRAVS